MCVVRVYLFIDCADWPSCTTNAIIMGCVTWAIWTVGKEIQPEQEKGFKSCAYIVKSQTQLDDYYGSNSSIPVSNIRHYFWSCVARRCAYADCE